MATTVGQHSVAAFTSPVNGTTPIDANTVRGNDNTVRVAYVDHDADPGIHVQSSTIASRPAAGTAGRKWIAEDSGVYTLWFDDGTNWHPVSSENVALTVLAGENLVKGDVVKVTGWNNGQDLPEVVKTTSASDTAFAVITAAVSSGSMGYATNTGIVQDVNTAAYSVGTILYANGSGGFTSTKPTSGHYQPCAYVLRSNTNNGVYYVEFSSPRIVESSANTASTIVLRDASGNFSAGTITAGALTSTGLVTFASLKGTGATTVTNILDEDNMASDSATALATQQSIKAYVDAKVATVDTLAEVLANGNTTGANDIIVNAGQKIRTPLIASQNNATAITIADTTGALTFASALADSNLATISTAGKVSNSATTATSANTASAIVARDASGNFTAGTITATLNGAAPAGSLSGTTLASGVTASSLTSVGTLTSLTVSGDLTVDTSTLKVDSANNRVGIGTATPSTLFHVRAATNKNFIVQDAGIADTVEISNYNTTDGIRPIYLSASTLSLATGTAGGGSTSTRMSIDASGNLAVDTNTLYVDAANNRVGIGTASPSSEFHVKGVGEIVRIETTGTTGNGYIAFFDPSASKGYVGYGASGNENFSVVNEENGAMVFSTNGNNLTLDASGNLGLGVTPSAWNTASFKALQVGKGSVSSNSDTAVYLGVNWVSESGGDKYIAAGGASVYSQSNGAHIWYNAGTGAAGDSISFTERMRLDTSGNLGVGTSPIYRLDVRTASGPYVAQFRNTSTSTSEYSVVLFNQAASGSAAGYVGTGGSAVGGAFANNFVVGTQSSNSLVFATNDFERARITSGGYLLIDTTAASGDARLVVNNADNVSGDFNTVKKLGANCSNTSSYHLICSTGADDKLYIYGNGNVVNTGNSYGTLSDEKLKQDIVDAPSQWNDLKAIKFRKYRLKSEVASNPDAPMWLGVVAQELEQVSPGLIDESEDFAEVEVTDEDGNVTTERQATGTVTKSVKTSVLLLKAAVALQEAMARIEALEARLEALEA